PSRTPIALRSASARFRGDVGWDITQTGRVVVLDGHGRTSVRLPSPHVTEVSLVRLKVPPALPRELTLGVDVDWSTDGIIDRLDGPWPHRRRCVEVTYTSGYETVPDDIQTAVLDQAEARYGSEVGIAQRAAGSESIRYEADAVGGMTQQWADAVARHSVAGDRS
ncbi:hypothetical protein, partial [Cellulosimicrobium sp. CpK407]|uniref:hypothetical protein n=1 Tax=Cellulosimicrobium sp. CpK407 TaxID=3229847 RepID=UPI003F3FD88E